MKTKMMLNKKPALTVTEARNILQKIHQPAHNSKLYNASRIRGGWLFYWKDKTTIPAGTCSIIVNDEGSVLQIGVGEPVEFTPNQTINYNDNN